MNHTMSGELTSYEKGNEGGNATHIQGEKMEGTSSFQVIEKPFPFLELPAEIRNAIYRLALLTQNVMTETISDLTCSKTLGEPNNFIPSTLTDEEEVGIVRCESWRAYAIGYQVSILRLNKQIHGEAWGIFQLENFWSIVRVNKEGFGAQMKVRGFPVKTGTNAWRHIKFPVMKMTVTFPSLNGQNQTDFFFLATVHLKELMRALWTAKGASEMEVLVHFQRPLTNNSPSQGDLLQPLYKLRNIKRTAAWSAPEQKYVDLLSRAVTTTEDINLIYRDLDRSNKCLQRYITAGRWQQAVPHLKEHSFFMNDCQIVYGKSLIGIEPDVNIHTAIIRGKKAKKIIIGTAMNMADVSFHQRLYGQSVLFAEHALFISDMSNFPYLDPPNIPATPSRRQCLMFFTRARAYMVMEQAEAAFRDLERIRKFKPDSKTLAAAYRVWQKMFGPFPGGDSSV